ncbi:MULTISPECIES: cytochrome c biogenesis CcdA family protein [Gammaproteobacteria]|jgi:cytochrome c-type biogenesis protein|uniref:cytochrome c biogenesis CcdA family protein n=1 Tax=Gammaproteobacteria TaxID=1236 RepID=UPI0007D02D39|nr:MULTISPECIES: cytochrome c biogenesis protein CcdA [Gammaproteobacteria]KZZ12262.1 cytochrome C biogenesis protein [Oleibacter sp. HI0075]MBN58502.1 cytochrome C biogenesis protein [Oceanospirillaceae bacterium]OUX67811.1 MAG: cytochrome C biogenesis protein [Oceanospirillaceae bacterium TMED276]HCG79659.1 cytochrome C biogenesis protein [Oceanospirillales bacterium]MAK44673.1 cytochrome C biogenesis protein [Spongiibacter sp.]|tara:strand:- start:1386 stop:1982 length:597 start_codon:yes stop_codon:yes gene_type:complete
MDTTAWMQMGGVAGLGAALLAGFLFSFMPVAFASIPVVLAYVTRARAFREAVSYGLAFAAGLILTHVVLGIGAALGLLWTGWLKIPLPWLPLRGKRAATLWGAFLLGMPFTVGICPVCSPGLWIGLGVSASIGSGFYGGLLMLAFALGRVIPLAVGAISIGWLENLKTIECWRRGFEIAGGITLMAIGAYLLNESYLL